MEKRIRSTELEVGMMMKWEGNYYDGPVPCPPDKSVFDFPTKHEEGINKVVRIEVPEYMGPNTSTKVAVLDNDKEFMIKDDEFFVIIVEPTKEEQLQEVVDWLSGCPVILDEATVPKAGIEANPEQVVINFSLSYVMYKKIMNLATKE